MESIKNIVTKIDELNDLKGSLIKGALISFRELLMEIEINYRQIALTEDEIRRFKNNLPERKIQSGQEFFKVYPYAFSHDVYKNKLSHLYIILDESTIIEIHLFYKNLEFLEKASQNLIAKFGQMKFIGEGKKDVSSPVLDASDVDPIFKKEFEDYLGLEKRTKKIGTSLINRLREFGRVQPSMLLVRNEYEYILEGTNHIKFIFRKIFNSVNKKLPNHDTSIVHNYTGKNIEFIGYLDIDGKSNFDLRLGNEIADKGTGGRLVPLLEEKAVEGSPDLKDFRFGIKCNTDLDYNDFYWIEIHARMKNIIERRGDELFTKLLIRFFEPCANRITVKIPNEKEGIIRRYVTEINKAVPSPNLTFDDSTSKVFTWNNDHVYPNQMFRIDLHFVRKITNTPLLKNLSWVLIGVGITMLINQFIN